MTKNIGPVDKIIRILLAVTFIVLYFTKQIQGAPAIVLIVLAIIFVITSLVGTCPLYLPLKLSTKKKEHK